MHCVVGLVAGLHAYTTLGNLRHSRIEDTLKLQEGPGLTIISLFSRTGVGAQIKWWQRGTGFGSYLSNLMQNFDANDVRYTVFSGVFQYVLPLVAITAIYLKIYHFLKVVLHIKLVYSWSLALSSLSENIIWSNSNNIKWSFPGLFDKLICCVCFIDLLLVRAKCVRCRWALQAESSGQRL